MSSLINQIDSYEVTKQHIGVLESSNQQLADWLFH